MSTSQTNVAKLDLPSFRFDRMSSAEQARDLSYLRDNDARLRDRFDNCGAASMQDSDLLELILFRVVSRRDAGPVARTLIARFGDLGGVLSASPSDLLCDPGISSAIVHELKLNEAVAHRIARAKILNRPIIGDWRSLLDYCHTTMSNCRTEQARVLYLDTKNALIRDEEQAQGTIDHVPIYPREIVRRALELNAKALILIHNHPSGDPTPSTADIEMTAQVARACATLDLTLHDHLIIGRGTELSFRAEGLL